MKHYTKDIIESGHTLSPLHCNFCDSKEVTFLQYVGDACCGDCGEWQMNNKNT